MGCWVAWKCAVACRFGELSQHPTWPHVRHSRRWTQRLPIFMQSSQPFAGRWTVRIFTCATCPHGCERSTFDMPAEYPKRRRSTIEVRPYGGTSPPAGHRTVRMTRTGTHDVGGAARSVALVPVALAAVAGYVDALAYVALHVLVAHMSGDTAKAMVEVAHGPWRDAWAPGCAIAAFVAGLLAGRFASDVARRRGIRRRLSVVLILEAALLVALALLVPRSVGGAIAVGAGAMGVQNATVRHTAGHDVRTTFVTGMIVSFADELFDRTLLRERDESPWSWLHLGVWIAFAAGACGGGLAATSAGVWPCVAVVLALVAWDAAAPLAPTP